MTQKCTQCGKLATKTFNWCATMGPQRAPLCDTHAQWWWDTFKHTPAGQTLSIENFAAKGEA